MSSRSPERGRFRSRTRSPANDSRPRSRSPSRSRTRSPVSPPPRRNGRFRRDSRSRSISRSRSRSRSYSRGRGRDSRDATPDTPSRSTKIVVERLTKTINEDHLYEIFGQFGRIKDLDLPINRSFGTNRGTAYILYDHEEDAEAAISNMHEAQVDGASIHVSIVLPRRKLSPEPPVARRGANIDPRVPFSGPRGGGPGGGGGRRRGNKSPSSRFGPRSDVYRPNSPRSQSPPRGNAGGGRFRSRSRGSFSSRSRSRSPYSRKRGGGGGGDDNGVGSRRRSRSVDSIGDRSRSRSRDSRM